MSSLSSSSSSFNPIEKPYIFPLDGKYNLELGYMRYTQQNTLLNGYHKTKGVLNDTQLEGDFTNSQLDGFGVMILEGNERILIGQFKKGCLYTGYFVAKNKDAPITHIREGRINFDFQGVNTNIDEAIPDKETVAKVKSILSKDWAEQLAEEAAAEQDN